MYVQCDILLLADVFGKFRDICIEIYDIDPPYFLSAPGLAWQACLEKAGVKLELLTDMFLMVEKGIRGSICQAIHRYAKANNKYMNNYVKSTGLSYLAYLDANNLYGYPMCEKLRANGFKWVEGLSRFNEDFIKFFDENSDKGYFFEVDVEYPKNLFNSHKDLPYLAEKKKIGKCESLICNIQAKKICCSHNNFKTSIKLWINTKMVHRVIQFNQKACLKPNIDMNTKLRKNSKNEFEKDFFKLMNNAVFGKRMENVENIEISN